MPVAIAAGRLHALLLRLGTNGRLVENSAHGARSHRPQTDRHDPGITPPRADAAPSGPAQKRDNETHRPVTWRSGQETDRGPAAAQANSGAGEKPAGRRLATDTRHRVDTDQEAKDLPLQDRGEGAGAGYCLVEPGRLRGGYERITRSGAYVEASGRQEQVENLPACLSQLVRFDRSWPRRPIRDRVVLALPTQLASGLGIPVPAALTLMAGQARLVSPFPQPF